MITFQKLFSVRIFALLSVILLLSGLGLALPGVAFASAPAAPGAGTVNHYYNGVDSSGGYNILDDQSAEKGVYTRFAFSDSTFHSTLGATLSYTVSGKPTWLSWYATDRTFYGTPKDLFGNPLLATYTITITANDGTSTDSLSFTLKIANVSDSGQHVPVYASDPVVEFYIPADAPSGTPLSPNALIAATDADSNIAGYRFVAPTGISIPFTIGPDGTIVAGAALTPGKYYYTVEAYDATGYQDTAHVIIYVTAPTAVELQSFQARAQSGSGLWAGAISALLLLGSALFLARVRVGR